MTSVATTADLGFLTLLVVVLSGVLIVDAVWSAFRGK